VYLIWKIESASGDMIRAMPVLFSTLEQATIEAAALNERFTARATGYSYVAREAHPEIINKYGRLERAMEAE